MSCASIPYSRVAQRHNAVVQCLAHLVRRSGVAAHIEPSINPWGVPYEGRNKRPDIIAIHQSGYLTIDVSITHPTSGGDLLKAATMPGAAAMARETAKRQTYANCPQTAVVGRAFVPFVLETSGRLGPEALRYLRELATRRYGAPPSTAKSQWVVWAASSISIAVQRGNATAFESARSLIMFGGAAHGRAPSRGHRR
jgi:hypothetical protein